MVGNNSMVVVPLEEEEAQYIWGKVMTVGKFHAGNTASLHFTRGSSAIPVGV
jgi:hypothetical protein